MKIFYYINIKSSELYKSISRTSILLIIFCYKRITRTECKISLESKTIELQSDYFYILVTYIYDCLYIHTIASQLNMFHKNIKLYIYSCFNDLSLYIKNQIISDLIDRIFQSGITMLYCISHHITSRRQIDLKKQWYISFKSSVLFRSIPAVDI